MTALKIVGAIVLFLLLLCMIRVHGMAEYSATGLLVKLRIGTIWITLYPRKKKKEKKPKQQAPQPTATEQPQAPDPQSDEQPPTVEPQGTEAAQVEAPSKQAEQVTADKENQPQKGGSFNKLKQYLPCIGKAAGGLKRRIVIDHLTLRFVAAAQDAMSAAMAFGYSNMLIGIILPIFEQNFTVKERDISTNVDFSAQKPTVYLNLTLSIRIGQAISLALRVLISLIRSKRKEEKRNSNTVY